jgi:hypothetical protein
MKCIFCMKRADSLEHVLPQWLYRCIAPETKGRLPIFVGHFKEGESPLRRNMVSLRLKARITCEECNTGWMARLEGEVKRILEPLTTSDFPVLAHSYFDLLRKHAETLGLWMAKTAVTTSFAVPGKQRLPDTMAEHIGREKCVPSGIFLDVAKSNTTGVAAGLSKTFPTINGSQFSGIQSEANGGCFQFCIQINHLLLRIAATPNAKVNYRVRTGVEPFRILPHAHLVVPENFGFQNFKEFFESIILTTWKDCPGEVPRGSILD